MTIGSFIKQSSNPITNISGQAQFLHSGHPARDLLFTTLGKQQTGIFRRTMFDERGNLFEFDLPEFKRVDSVVVDPKQLINSG